MPGSRSSRVLWALEEAGATYDLTFLTREQKSSDEHAKRHPLRRVPVLELDDGRFIFESAAIALYLGDIYPEAGLLPAIGDPQRAEAYQWTLLAMSELEPAVFGWRRARREERDESEAEARLTPIHAALSEHLEQRTWLLGDTFSIPDVLVATLLSAVVSTPLGDPSDAVKSYVERAQQRPAFQRAEELGKRRPEAR